MPKKQIAAQLYTVRDTWKTLPELVTTLKKVAAIGYTLVETSGFKTVDLKDAAKALEDCGLKALSSHGSWNRFVGELDKVVEEIKLFGSKHCAIGGLFGPEYKSIDGLKRFVAELGPVAERLAKEGIQFSYHNHNHELAKYEGRTWLERALEMTRPGQMNFEIDTHWIQAGGGDPAAWVAKFAGRIPLLHVKDMNVTPEREQRHAAVGEGNMNFAAIVKAAKKAKVQYYIVEQDQCYGLDHFDCMAASYRNLKALGLN